jgi:hypothetical protein
MTLEPDRSRGPATPPAQLLVYGFAPGAAFEGQLVGAIERIESSGTLRVLDVLFVMRDAETAELVAVERRGRGEGSLVAPLLGFRLDPGERRRVSEKALRAGAHSGALRQLGEALEPGAAVAAVLVEHVWVRALDDAVSRTGGKPLASELVDAASLGELTADLIQAAARGEELG